MTTPLIVFKVPPMKTIRSRHWSWRTGLTCLCWFIACTTWNAGAIEPSLPKSIKIVVGPGPDILARGVAEQLTESLNIPVIVEQKTGGGGVIAGDAVAKSPADGAQLLLSTGSFTINSLLQPNPPYQFSKDLTPVSLLATLPFVLIVKTESKFKSLGDIVQYAKSNPDKLNYASSGNGTPPHILGEMLKQYADVKVPHIPYKSAAAAMNDVLGGQVDFMFVPAPTALSLIKSDKLRALAVTSSQRYPGLPQVATMMESGYAKFVMLGWNGIHVSSKTSKNLITLLNTHLVKAVKSPQLQNTITQNGFEPVGSSAEFFAEFVQQDIDKNRAVIQQANIKVE